MSDRAAEQNRRTAKYCALEGASALVYSAGKSLELGDKTLIDLHKKVATILKDASPVARTSAVAFSIIEDVVREVFSCGGNIVPPPTKRVLDAARARLAEGHTL